jgi:predicted aspartyl protease
MSVVTFHYDPTYYPAVPVIHIEVDGYDSLSGQRSLPAIVDSGADATMIPLPVLEAIGAAYKESTWMKGVAGGRVEVDLYLAAIRIGPHVIGGLHVVGIPAAREAIIGRDVLNQLIVTLNGLASVTEIHT